MDLLKETQSLLSTYGLTAAITTNDEARQCLADLCERYYLTHPHITKAAAALLTDYTIWKNFK